MTIQAVLDKIDNEKPNMVPVEEKISMLSELDGIVYREVYMTHEGNPAGEHFEGYDLDTPTSVELLIPDAYSNVYKLYLAAEIDDIQRETNEYAKSRIRFNSAWQTFCDFWTRTHMPKQTVQEFRL